MRIAEPRYGGVCDECGNEMTPTGEKRKGPLQPAIGSAGYRVVKEKYVCEPCQRYRWEPIDAEDEPEAG